MFLFCLSRVIYLCIPIFIVVGFYLQCFCFVFPGWFTSVSLSLLWSAFISSVFVLSFQGDLPLYPYLDRGRPIYLVFFVLSFYVDLPMYPYLYCGRPLSLVFLFCLFTVIYLCIPIFIVVGFYLQCFCFVFPGWFTSVSLSLLWSAFISSVFVLSFQGNLPLYPYLYCGRPLSVVFLFCLLGLIYLCILIFIVVGFYLQCFLFCLSGWFTSASLSLLWSASYLDSRD